MKKLTAIFSISFVLAFSTSAYAEPNLETGEAALKAKDFQVAIANLEPLANDGNSQAAFRMCGMYYLAQGVPKNDAESARFCRIAAEKGNTEAMYNLALMYQKGEGVGQDINEAQRWYAAAAARGNPDAKYNLKQIQLANQVPSQSRNLDLVRGGAANLRHKSTAPVAIAAAQPQLQPPVPPQPPMPPAPQQVAEIPPLLEDKPLGPQVVVGGTQAPTEDLRLVSKQEIQAEQVPVVAAIPPQAPVAPQQYAQAQQPQTLLLNTKQQIKKPQSKPLKKAAIAQSKPLLPPIPPAMPVPPTAPVIASAAPIEKAFNPNASPSESPEIARYCVIAAQRGNPDPKCGKAFSSLLKPASPAKKPAPVAAPVQQVAQIEPQNIPPAPHTLFQTKPELLEPSSNTQADVSATQATSALVTNAPVLPIPEPVRAQQPVAVAKVQEHNFKWFVDQANTGNAQAQNNLGVMYRRGLNGAPVNVPESIKWFERSASQGSTNGMLNLASVYKSGEGTNQNLELAYAWYNVAAGRLPRGNAKKNRAQESVQEISQYLTNEQIGDALQYVTELEEHIPVMNEPVDLTDDTKTTEEQKVEN